VSFRNILAAVLLLTSPAAEAQKTAHIGFLAGGARATDAVLLASFWQGMRELGYVEGKNIIAEYSFAEGSAENLPRLAQELVRMKVDVIVGPGSGAVAAKRATDTIPIVITYGDPIALGLVSTLARPGGNVTGLSGFASDLGGKQLEVLKQAFPRVSRVAVLWSQSNAALLVQNMKVDAGRLGLTLQLLELRDAKDVGAALAAAKDAQADALVVSRNPFTATDRVRIAQFAARNHLPAIYGDREFIEAGGLMSYGVSIPELWRRSAAYVDKILKGTPPAAIPVERPTKFEMVINLKAAQAGGLAIAPSLLSRADEVLH